MTAVEEVDGFDAVPGDPDLWLFVVVESLVFTSYFCVYLWARTQDEAAFLAEQSALTMWLGVLDTIVLLTSSWSIARCVQHTRAGRFGEAWRAALVTTGLGVAFGFAIAACLVAGLASALRGGKYVHVDHPVDEPALDAVLETKET